MNFLLEKIQEVEQFRDSYFEKNPEKYPADKIRAVREKVMPLIQDIPLDMNGLSSTPAEYNYICGRILNICTEYDSNSERYLIRAIKLDPSMSDAWHELGECVWKRKDYKAAADCFRTSLANKRTAKSLTALALSLRQDAASAHDARVCKKLREEAAELSAEAVQLDPTNEVAWHAMGNTYLLQFFEKCQKDASLLEKAREAYEKALQLGDKHYSSDLHLNYATALKFNQDYGQCLKHLKIAALYDPGFLEVKEQLETLCSFLKQINMQVRRKGKLSAKKLRNMQNSIGEQDFGIYGKKTQKKDIGLVELERKSFKELKEGINEGIVIAGKVIAVVPNPEIVPHTFIGCDKTGCCSALTVYNCSKQFGMVVGDSFAVPEPCVIDVKVSFDVCGMEDLDFRIVRIMNPLNMLKNGKTLSERYVAYCNLVTDFFS